MAKARIDNELEKLRDSATCPLCLEVFEDPKLLPCSHTYCSKCIKGLMDEHKHKGEFPCPECRKPCKIPANGIKELAVNSVINSLVDVIKNVLKSKDMAVNIYCDFCAESNKLISAVSKCMECNDNMCKQCSCAHKASKLSRNHTLISLTGDQAQDASKAMQLFDSIMNEYQTGRDRCDDLISNLRNNKELAEYDAKNNLSFLSKQREAHFIALNKAYDQLSDEVTDIKNNTVKNILAHITDVELHKGILTSTINHIDQLKKHGNAVEIITNVPELKSKHKDLLKLPTIALNDLSTTEVTPGIADTFTITFAEVSEKPIAAHMAPPLLAPLTAVGELVEPHLENVVDIEGITYISDLTVTSDHDVVVIDFDMKIANLYDCMLKLKCSIDTEACFVSNTPDNMLAFSKPQCNVITICDTAGAVRRTIKVPTLKDPCGLAMSSSQLAVCDQASRQVVSIDYHSGQVLSTTPAGTLESPIDVAYNSREHMLISDYDAHCIKCINKQGQCVFTYGSEGSGEGNMKYPIGICTDAADHIIIADASNHRVQLVSPDGHFIRYLATEAQGLFGLHAVTINHKGHLLVGDATGKVFEIKYRR